MVSFHNYTITTSINASYFYKGQPLLASESSEDYIWLQYNNGNHLDWAKNYPSSFKLLYSGNKLYTADSPSLLCDTGN